MNISAIDGLEASILRLSLIAIGLMGLGIWLGRLRPAGARVTRLMRVGAYDRALYCSVSSVGTLPFTWVLHNNSRQFILNWVELKHEMLGLGSEALLRIDNPENGLCKAYEEVVRCLDEYESLVEKALVSPADVTLSDWEAHSLLVARARGEFLKYFRQRRNAS